MTDRYQPDLKNQFNRLIQRTAKSYDLGPAWNNRHMDANHHLHNFDSENCMAAAGAVAADAQTGGQRSLSPGDIRNHQHDFAGGIGHDDVEDAFVSLGISKFLRPDDTDWDQSMEWMREGRFVWWAVLYGAVPYQYQEQKGGTFAHALGGCNVYADGSFDRYDSLAKTIRRVPQSAVKAAAEAMAIDERGSRNRLFVGATKVLPPLGFVLYPTAVKTKPFPDRTRAAGKHGQPVNVHSRPRTGTASVVGTLATGKLFTAYQKVTHGDPFEGSRVWYGNRNGTRWISAERLHHEGGST